jgi:hypothetical protein
MKMTTIKDIERATKDFLEKHWNSVKCGDFGTTNREEWEKLVGTTPNSTKQGCYVFILNDGAFYVGSAVSKGSGIYVECGIGDRLNDYTEWARDAGALNGKRSYRVKGNLDAQTRIFTLGFPSGFGYLALALEAYLIVQFKGDLKNIKATK